MRFAPREQRVRHSLRRRPCHAPGRRCVRDALLAGHDNAAARFAGEVQREYAPDRAVREWTKASRSPATTKVPAACRATYDQLTVRACGVIGLLLEFTRTRP